MDVNATMNDSRQFMGFKSTPTKAAMTPQIGPGKAAVRQSVALSDAGTSGAVWPYPVTQQERSEG